MKRKRKTVEREKSETSRAKSASGQLDLWNGAVFERGVITDGENDANEDDNGRAHRLRSVRIAARG